MTLDLELAAWRQEWRAESEALPDVRKKIRRQDQWTWIAISLACVCMALSLFLVWRTRTAFSEGFAAGLWFSCLTMGAYVWRLRRGTWRPEAQTTAAYLELWHRRSIARERIARVSFRFLLVTAVVYAGIAAWNWKDFSTGSAIVLTAIAAELLLLHRIAQKKQREVETTRKLLASAHAAEAGHAAEERSQS